MNVVVIDTSSWVSYFRGKENADLELALQEGRAFVPPIVISELLSARLKPGEQKVLKELLVELPMCETPFEHWERVGLLRSRLLSKGMTVSTPDAHVAQCCLDKECYLMTDDAIFTKMAKILNLKILK